MNQALHTAPVCEKHGCEKVWSKNKSFNAGGRWVCRMCRSEACRKYRRRAGAKPRMQAVPKSGTPSICEKHGCERIWSVRKAHKNGGIWICGECRKINNARYREANREKRLISKRATSRRWREANPEEAKIRSNASGCVFKKKYPEKVAATKKQWKQENPEKVCCDSLKRRALKRNAVIPNRPVTVKIQKERKALFGGCCFCGSQEKLTVEHLIPLSRGGLHVPENLLGSCKTCNCRKGVSPVEEWFRKQPFFTEERWSAIKSCTNLDS